MHNLQKYDYGKLLKRAEKALPKDAIVKERFEMPKAAVFYEGKTTILRNLSDIASKTNREVDHLFSYLLKELGTAGEVEGEDGCAVDGRAGRGRRPAVARGRREDSDRSEADASQAPAGDGGNKGIDVQLGQN